MSRKTIFILLTILVVALGVWVIILARKPVTSGDGLTSEKGIFGSLFPFGSNSGDSPTDGTEPGATTGGDTAPDQTPSTSNNRLAQIVNNPTAGFIVIVPPVVKAPPKTATAPTVTVPALPTVRFVEKGTGYVLDVGAKGGNPTKVSGTVIPRTAQALFGDNGESVIFRYAKTDNHTVATYLGRVVPSVTQVTAGSVKGSYLADDILDVAMAPDGKSFMYLLPTDTGSVGMTMKTDGTGEKQAFTSPFSEWLLDWSSLGTVLTTKAASTVPGYAYQLSAGGVMTKLVGGLNGLTTKMSPDGKNVLYSVSDGPGLSLRIRHLKDGSEVNTGLATLPEKCAWTADSKTAYCGASNTLDQAPYPENWYQGIAHFNDALWSVDAEKGTTVQVNDGEGNYLDMTHLALDSKNEFVFFINKNNGSLWSFDLVADRPVTTTTVLP